MTNPDLTRLLVDTVHEAERQAPEVNPMHGLAQARRSRRQRREHLAVLAFVLFAFVLQLLPAEALGAAPAGPALAVSADRPGDARVPAPRGV